MSHKYEMLPLTPHDLLVLCHSERSEESQFVVEIRDASFLSMTCWYYVILTQGRIPICSRNRDASLRFAPFSMTSWYCEVRKNLKLIR
ncbi:MAG: hypothetical protein HC815_38800 [Richelia sp. RM1_1_1]|nr:hypothetical protein [Richelia sp. SM2_1_7]NJN13534.1 hypothetical protein [Richelia sp. RM1_1_1]